MHFPMQDGSPQETKAPPWPLHLGKHPASPQSALHIIQGPQPSEDWRGHQVNASV